jgi:hypothetical protein
MFCHVVRDILGLESGKTWNDVRRELSDEQVIGIHTAFRSLWPEDTDLSELLPRPKKDTFRAVYLGTSDPRTVVATAVGWLPYFDQVVLAHPFTNPLRVRPEYSPVESPSQHKAQTLKNVLLLLTLEPFIRTGHVHLIPNPGDINPHFGMAALRMAEQRTAVWKTDPRCAGALKALAEDDQQRFMRQLPESALRQFMREDLPEASDAEIEATIAYMKLELEADPCALLQPINPGEENSQLLYYTGYSLEAALYLASLTGSIVYTDVEAHWQQLHMHAGQASQPPSADWGPVARGLRTVDFPISTDVRTICEDLQAGRFGRMRLAFRQLAGAFDGASGPPQPNHIELQMANAAQAMQGEQAKVPNAERLAGHIGLSIPSGGFERNDVRRLLLTFGRAKSVRPIPFAMLIKLEAASASDG